MSPEQAAGAAHRIDGRTDIYSLGMVLYQMLCGRVPFRANHPRELLRQVREDEPQPPRQLDGDIPPELERACLKALAKRQQDRYTTAADFAEDLRAGHSRLPGRSTRHHPGGPPPGYPVAMRHRGAGSIAAELRDVAARPPPRPRGRAPSDHRPGLRLRTVRVRSIPGGSRRGGPGRSAANFQQAASGGGRFDGTVVQCNEQGVLVCFGYPVAFEDAARRAARPASASSRNQGPRRTAPPRTRAGAESVGRHPHRPGRRGDGGECDLAGGRGAERGGPAGGRRRARPRRLQRGHAPADPGPVSNASASVTTRSRGWRSPSNSSEWTESVRTTTPSRRRDRPGSRR